MYIHGDGACCADSVAISMAFDGFKQHGWHVYVHHIIYMYMYIISYICICIHIIYMYMYIISYISYICISYHSMASDGFKQHGWPQH